MTGPIRVVVADDSPFVCRLLTSYLQSSPDFQVVGTALNGSRAVELVKELRPDTVTLDLEMPEMNGLEALEHIMYDCPTPVVLVSGVSRRAAAITLQALDLGAVDFILKYIPGLDTNPEALRQEIMAKVRAASQIKVIRSLRTHRPQDEAAAPALRPLDKLGTTQAQDTAPSPAYPPAMPEVDDALPERAQRRDVLPFLPGGVVVIGASTGGPVALRELLGNLPADFPAAVIIIQHMPATFTEVLAAQLDRQVPLKVKEAQAGDRLQPGLALVAPGDYHLLLRPDSRVELSRGPEIGGHRPSIDVTMQSVAQLYGARTKGVVLTGMGNDGSLGLVSIRAKGGKTFAQDAASCVVNGMPQRSIEKGVVDHVASPTKIAQLLRLGHAWTLEE
jgi:two-component system chemotaxis response regulator CheB